MAHHQRRRALALIQIGITLFLGACRQADEESAGGDQLSEDAQPRGDLLVFPGELRVEDESVNEFVVRAMTTCASGDYAAFRLLWSVLQEPLPRDEYKKGWQAVQEIRIRALKEIALAPGSQEDPGESKTAYVVVADVALDPSHPAARSQPQRQAVLMIVKEREEWRLAQATKRVRAWVTAKLEARQEPPRGPSDDAQEPGSEAP